MSNKVCEILGIEKPIIQGAMAWAATYPLVAAVSNAGALGTLGVGFAPPEIVRSEIQKTLELTDKPFAANVFIEPAFIEKAYKIPVEVGAPIVYADTIVNLDYELAKKYIEYWHENGLKVIVKASILKDAVTAEKAGADVIIVKGWEAGGHVTYESTMAFVPLTKQTVSCPVVAGGGIADGRGMAAAYALGADAVEMGSAFLLADECPVHPNVKQAIIEAGDMSTVVTAMATDEPCRQLQNPLSDKLFEIEYSHAKADAAEILRNASASSLRLAMMEGDMVDGAVMVGQVAALLNHTRPAKEIIDDTIAEAREVIKQLSI